MTGSGCSLCKKCPTGRLSTRFEAIIGKKRSNLNIFYLQYKVTIEENQSDKLILRIPVNDEDLVDTPNWISQFIITKGNESGHFRIERDPKTNDALLYVLKVSKTGYRDVHIMESRGP